MASPEGFARRHRFQGREAFSPVLSAGRRLHAGDLTLIVAPALAPASRLGVAIGRRVSPKATVRNRLKRLAREAFRRHPAKMSRVDLVVLGRASRGGPDPRRWAEALDDLLGRALQASRA